jgi:hypothetical protein
MQARRYVRMAVRGVFRYARDVASGKVQGRKAARKEKKALLKKVARGNKVRCLSRFHDWHG